LPHCDCSFSGKRRQASTDIEPRRHQVTELPPIQAHMAEYRCQSIVCPDCGKATQTELPQEVRHFGPELTALIAYLTVVCRVVQEVLGQVLGIPLSLGSIQNSWEEASEAVAEPCTELEKQLAHEPVINSDETGYQTSGDKRWLWALVATSFVFYKIALTRGAEVLVQLLGEVFAGILCSDRCPTYLTYHKGEGQFCWAHFKRNILGYWKSPKPRWRNASAAMRWLCMLAFSAYGTGSAPARRQIRSDYARATDCKIHSAGKEVLRTGGTLCRQPR
jgi:transposase